MANLLQEATAKIDEYARGMISGSGSTLFEELGLYYIGPIDGHNLDLIIAMLQGTILSSSQGPTGRCQHEHSCYSDLDAQGLPDLADRFKSCCR